MCFCVKSTHFTWMMAWFKEQSKLNRIKSMQLKIYDKFNKITWKN